VDVILLKNFLWGGSFICVGNMDGILERWREGKKEKKKYKPHLSLVVLLVLKYFPK